jgi:hypothetical protein
MSGERPKPIAGIVIVVIGIILLLNNLGATSISIWMYWPVILIIWGLSAVLTGSKSFGAITLSALVALLGFVLLGKNLGWFTVNLGMVFKFFWPLLIIVIGLSIFLGQSLPGKSNLAIMGAVERGKGHSWNLATGSYLAFMGGVELDLRSAVIPDGETVLDLTAIMGGVEVRVPSELPVICDGFAILGGVNLLGKGSGGVIGSARAEQAISPDNTRLVRIQARAIMGGIEIKK